MSNYNCHEIVVGVFATHRAAEEAVQSCSDAGLPIDKMAIICRSHDTREVIKGFCGEGFAIREGAVVGAAFGALLGITICLEMLFQPGYALAYMFVVLAFAMTGAIAGAASREYVMANAPRRTLLRCQRNLEPEQFLVVFGGQITESITCSQATWPPVTATERYLLPASYTLQSDGQQIRILPGSLPR